MGLMLECVNKKTTVSYKCSLTAKKNLPGIQIGKFFPIIDHNAN